VRLAPKRNVRRVGWSAEREWRDVMELETFRLGTAATSTNECASSLVPIPDRAPNRRRNVPRTSIGSAPTTISEAFARADAGDRVQRPRANRLGVD